MIDLIRERWVNHLLVFVAGSVVSLFGFTLIGLLHSSTVRRRLRQPITLPLLLSDVYPSEMYGGQRRAWIWSIFCRPTCLFVL